MPFVEGGLVEDAVETPQGAGVSGFVEGGKVEDLTPEDSYNLVSAYESGQLDVVPTKEEFLAYNKVKKEKPLLGERPMETVAGAAVETGKFLAPDRDWETSS